MNATDQDRFATLLMDAARHAGISLAVPRQEAGRMVEMPAGLPEWKAVVGLIYQRGYVLRSSPAYLDQRPALRLLTDEVEGV